MTTIFACPAPNLVYQAGADIQPAGTAMALETFLSLIVFAFVTP
jgi:hypothetical protein